MTKSPGCGSGDASPSALDPSPACRRPHLSSLWIRLLAGLVLVAIVSVGIVAVLANRTTAREFQLYVSQGRRVRAEQLAPQLSAFYAQTGSWEGVEGWIGDLLPSQATRPGQGRGLGQRSGASLDRVLLTAPSGQVLADSQQLLVGQQLPDADLAFGAPVNVGGQTVGVVLVPAAGDAHDSLETEFLRQVNRSLLWAGVAACGIALVLGLVLSRQLTAPLHALTQATRSLARGQATEVKVRGHDEIGELGKAFNQMATSLAQQETLRRNLMADIAHELRTPLSVIRGDLEALLDGVYEPTPEALASLQEEALLLTRLVEDLRDLAQAGAGQLQLDCQPVDLANLLRSVAASFEPLAAGQGQQLLLSLPPTLPLVRIDRQRVRQIVANLISNALRHAAVERGEVLVSAVEREDEVQVSVSDNGPGISAQDVPHVFERFWKGDRGRTEGSGLGLTIARELVHAHGGRIWVESAPNEGATFYFTLPVSRGS